MRKLIITGMAVAMLAVPAAASADVAVNDQGVGTIGKGDVQNALGYHNDAALQADAAKITFTQQADVMSTMVHGVKCAPVSSTGVLDMTQVHVLDAFNIGNFGTTTKTFTATPKGGKGKVTGWSLTGDYTTTTTPGTTNYSLITRSCPAGEHFAGYVDPADVFSNPITPGGGLMVSNATTTVALPNTPVL